MLNLTTGSRRIATNHLQKYFNAVLQVPSLLPRKLDDYAGHLLTQAGFADEPDVRKVTVAAYGSETPRQVKRFVNDLVSAITLIDSLTAGRLLPTDVPESRATLSKALAIRSRWMRHFQDLAHDPSLADIWLDAAERPGAEDPGVDPYLWIFLRATAGIRLPADPQLLLYLAASDPEELYLTNRLGEALRGDQFEQFSRTFGRFRGNATAPTQSLFSNIQRTADKASGARMLRWLLRIGTALPDLDMRVLAEPLADWLFSPPSVFADVGDFVNEREELSKLIAATGGHRRERLANWVVGRIEDAPVHEAGRETVAAIAGYPGVLSDGQATEVGQILARQIREGGRSLASALQVSGFAIGNQQFWPSAVTSVISAILDRHDAPDRPLDNVIGSVLCSIVFYADASEKDRFARLISTAFDRMDAATLQVLRTHAGWKRREAFTENGLVLIAHSIAEMIHRRRDQNVAINHDGKEVFIALLPLFDDAERSSIDAAYASLYSKAIGEIGPNELLGRAADCYFVEQHLPMTWELIKDRLRD